MEILIIGTRPPCPRCDLLGLWVDEILAGEGLNRDVKVKHLSFNDPEIAAFSRERKMKVGTAKHVAIEAGIHLDKKAIDTWFEKRKAELEHYTRPADLWDEELDHLLAECQQVAESVSYLMTPVLVINGVVMHHGSVPARTDVVKWILESVPHQVFFRCSRK